MQGHGAAAGAVEAEHKSMQEHGAGAGACKSRIKSICRSMEQEQEHANAG